MHKFSREKPLIALLNSVVDGLMALHQNPIFVGECPHKFNDADGDDLWFAVQAGLEYWEQSHFFQGGSLVREQGQFALSDHAATVGQQGATVTGPTITFLRDKLKHLQQAGWRDLSGYPGLIGLVIQDGQPWLVLAHSSMQDDATIYAWDDSGFFPVGCQDRIDTAIGATERLIRFETVIPEGIKRLRPSAQHIFCPRIVDPAGARELASAIHTALSIVNKAQPDPFAFFSSGSAVESQHFGHWRPAQIFSEGLREGEGFLRHPKDGDWGTFQKRTGRIDAGLAYSDQAKTLHMALAQLEDLGWRSRFEQAFGERLKQGQDLCLLVDREDAFLVRDNAAFCVGRDGLTYLGAFDHPNGHGFQNSLEEMLDRKIRPDSAR